MKHVFISYVHDDLVLVERLCNALKVSGINVWLDRDDIKPGMRWEDAIRNAIADGTYFIACFSKEYSARSRSYMNEELTLAVEELRRRPTDRVWFIPVLLTEGEIPSRSIGAGEDLRSLQWVELYKDWSRGIGRIVSVIEPSAVTHPGSFTNPIDGSPMELVPGGTYNRMELIGRAHNTGPLGQIQIPDFYMSLHPVTNSQYRLFLQQTSALFRVQPWFMAKTTANTTNTDSYGKAWSYPPDHWVGGVGYLGAQAYCGWAKARLPSIFEIEHFVLQVRSGKRLVEGINHASYKYKPFHWTSTKESEIGGETDGPVAKSVESGALLVDKTDGDRALFDVGFRCAADVDNLQGILRSRI